MTAHIEIDKLVALLSARAPELVAALGLDGQRRGHEFVALNPTRADTRLGSFSIRLDGPRAGVWSDFAAGESGDALDLVAYVQGYSKAEAVRWAKGFLGLSDEAAAAPRRNSRQLQAEARARQAKAVADDAKVRKRAFQLYLDAQASIRDTPADFYLRRRLLDLRRLGRQPGALRYHWHCWNSELRCHRPALLACINDAASGDFMAVHRTYLREHPEHGWIKDWTLTAPKKCYGRMGGGVIRLWRGEHIDRETGEIKMGVPIAKAENHRLVLGEGIETVLTAILARPEWRAWAAVSLGNMAALNLPACINEILILAENDNAQEAMRTLNIAIGRFQSEGRRVLIAALDNAESGS